jgi:hypothetical protein
MTHPTIPAALTRLTEAARKHTPGGVPVSSLTGGDRAGQIATVKGQVLALEARVAGCL